MSEKQLTDRVFPLLKFAAYLQDWAGPAEGERPTAYIVVMVDERIKRQADLDAGIAAQTMMLGAVEKGYGGCMMSSVQREKLAELLGLPEYYQIVWVMALGKPIEQVVVEDVDETCRELDRAGYVDVLYADDMAYIVQLTDTAIIYMENRFKDGLVGVLNFLSGFIP